MVKAIGITGTQVGGTEDQLFWMRIWLAVAKLNDYTELHHGDCVGVDAEAHEMAVVMGFHVVIHPPENSSKRAFCTSGHPTILAEKPYLERNHDIVKATQLLLAFPRTEEEWLHSGTWATIRFAKKFKKPHHVIAPYDKILNIPVGEVMNG